MTGTIRLTAAQALVRYAAGNRVGVMILGAATHGVPLASNQVVSSVGGLLYTVVAGRILKRLGERGLAVAGGLVLWLVRRVRRNRAKAAA